MYMIVYSPQQERKNKIIQYIYIRPLLSILNYASKIQSDSQGEGGGWGGGVEVSIVPEHFL